MGLDQGIRIAEHCPGDDSCDHFISDEYRKPHLETSDLLIRWRKENHLHRWFETHCLGHEMENCDAFEVNLEQLAGLARTIERVLEDRSLAQELLPTEAGLFYGSTDYGDYYFADLQRELDEIRALLIQQQALAQCGQALPRLAYWAWW